MYLTIPYASLTFILHLSFAIFPCPSYFRSIQVNYKHNLVAVYHKKKTAIFAKLDKDNELVPFEVSTKRVYKWSIKNKQTKKYYVRQVGYFGLSSLNLPMAVQSLLLFFEGSTLGPLPTSF